MFRQSFRSSVYSLPTVTPDRMTLPDPLVELRMTSLHSTRGANYWSRRPVTRLDIAVGAYENISSAEAPGFAEAVVAMMPGLEEHRCSIGERGGFITRLEHGTYAAHIIEHIALELQIMIGHDVGFGRTRGGDVDGEYTIVFEHLHEAVGLRAAALALEMVQRAFAGTLGPVDHATAELAALAQTADVPRLQQHVLCGITGGAARGETRDEIVRRGSGTGALIVDVSPAYLLQAGLPYSRSDIAIVLDATLTDVPERYRQEERAQRLVATVADAVDRGGIVIVPAKEWEVQDLVRDAGCRVAIFAADADITRRDKKVARAAAYCDGGRIIIETRRGMTDAGALHDEVPSAAQAAAALAAFTLRELHPEVAGAAASTE
jgi:Cyanophycin synthase-like N-terminal domain